MLVEAELVDGVVTRHPLADELGDRRYPGREFVGTVVGHGRTGRAALVDLADDTGDLLGGCTRGGIFEQRRMTTRALGPCRSSPLSRRPARNRVQRNNVCLRIARHVVTHSPKPSTKD